MKLEEITRGPEELPATHNHAPRAFIARASRLALDFILPLVRGKSGAFLRLEWCIVAFLFVFHGSGEIFHTNQPLRFRKLHTASVL